MELPVVHHIVIVVIAEIDGFHVSHIAGASMIFSEGGGGSKENHSLWLILAGKPINVKPVGSFSAIKYCIVRCGTFNNTFVTG